MAQQTIMQLLSFSYCEYMGKPQEWAIDGLRLHNRNLVVGKNSSGKSRTLNVVSALATTFSGIRSPADSGTYKCELIAEGKIYNYSLELSAKNITKEALYIDDKLYLDRGSNGVGKIWAEKLDMFIDFQMPSNMYATVSRRDGLQHSFLEPLYIWGTQVRHYHFGSTLGKDALAVFTPDGVKVDDRDENAVVALFREGEKVFGDAFIQSLKNDMKDIGYDIEDITLGLPVTFIIEHMNPPPFCLLVKERGVSGLVDQFAMSQGMFRALSILIHMTFSCFSKRSSCILIDDIGEGLDFERSCKLINILRHKTELSDIQLIMSTNDRFVMNEVPLSEWSILQRVGNRVSVRNSNNSQQAFEDFRFTGLSNFSFFEMDFLEHSGQ